jgi:hypothetical protein
MTIGSMIAANMDPKPRQATATDAFEILMDV